MTSATIAYDNFSITPIYAFSDNYIWCLHDNEKAWVVDPGDHEVVETFLKQNNLSLEGILITHHHWDHTNGIKSLLQDRDIPVYGPEHAKVPAISHLMNEGDEVTLFGTSFNVLEVPGHTLDHIAYAANKVASSDNNAMNNILFCGDTLFSAGCGRLFEGSPEQMHTSMQKLSALGEDTLVFCTHEYTESNLKFAQAVEPQNSDITNELRRVQSLNVSIQPSLPSSIAKEKAINPFLRTHLPSVKKQAAEAMSLEADKLDEIECFAAVRRWKDSF